MIYFLVDDIDGKPLKTGNKTPSKEMRGNL